MPVHIGRSRWLLVGSSARCWRHGRCGNFCAAGPGRCYRRQRGMDFFTQTFDTLDYLSQAGIEYIGDWVLDDESVWLKTKHKPVAAFP